MVRDKSRLPFEVTRDESLVTCEKCGSKVFPSMPES